MRPVILASLLFAVSASADSRVDELTRTANALLARGSHQEAVDALTSALRLAADAGDRDAQVESKFAVARVYEEWAAADAVQGSEHLQSALNWYRRLWSEEPKRRDAAAAAHNNSAQILARLGENEAADGQFQAAIAIGDELRPFYLANYAGFLASRGNREGAISRYEEALAKTPDDVVTEAKLLRLYPGARVVDSLWQLAGRGALVRAQELALEHLGRDLDANVKRDLLAVVAATLAQQHVTPADFAESTVNARLTRLAEEGSLRDGIRELRRLYEGSSLDPQTYSWWRESAQQRKLPVMEPPLAFSALATELGGQIAATLREQAERYFTLAIDVTRGHDPEPFIALADLYYRHGEAAKLAQFDRRYHTQILEMKGAALRTGDWRSVYRFQIALGTIYARLGAEGDASQARAAIFYFENAQNSARELSEATKTSVVLDARSVDLLAQSYARAEPGSGKDVRLRLDSAEEYRKTGRTTSARRVLEPAIANPGLLRGEEKLRLEKLQLDLQVPPVSGTPTIELQKLRLLVPDDVKLDPSTTATIEEILGMYLAPRVPEERTEAERKLKQYGITDIRPDKPLAGSLLYRHNAKPVTMKFAQMESGTSVAPPAAAKAVRLHLPAGVTLDGGTVKRLEKLLADYYAAEGTLRSDMASKLDGFGIAKINEPAGDRGSVVLLYGGRTLTIPFELGSH